MGTIIFIFCIVKLKTIYYNKKECDKESDKYIRKL